MEHWWNDTDWRKLKYWEKNLSQSHFVHHKSHTDWLGIEQVTVTIIPCTCIREIFGLNLFSVFPSPCRKMPRYYLGYSTIASFQILSTTS